MLERLLLLFPGDLDASLRACKLSLVVRAPRRGLVAVRGAMDEHPDDAALVSAAARALDAMGERIRGVLLHREAARRLERAGDAEASYDEWRTVLAFDPSDTESLDHMRALSAAPPAAGPAGAPAAPMMEVEPDEILPPPGREPTLEMSLDDEVSAARVEVDVPVAPMRSTPVPLVMPEPMFVLAEEGAADESLPLPMPVVGPPFGSMRISAPSPAPSPSPAPPRSPPPPALESASPAPPPAAPAVRSSSTAQVAAAASRALVVGDGPEAAWIERALCDRDFAVERMGRDAMSQALEKAEQVQPELVFSPPALAEAWRESGPWHVASLVAPARSSARAAVAAAGLEVVSAVKVDSAEALRGALLKFGAPLELVGPHEGPVLVPATGSPGYHLTVARERLGQDLLGQAAQRERTCVLVAGDGKDAAALADWQEGQQDGVALFESPATGDSGARLVLASRVARALGIRGLAVVVLARAGDGFAFESFRLAWGPGGLAVEARTGASLVDLSLQLARGGGHPLDVERRGVALAAAARGSLASVANLRVEPSADGSEFFVCAHATDRAQALRRLMRAVKAQ